MQKIKIPVVNLKIPTSDITIKLVADREKFKQFIENQEEKIKVFEGSNLDRVNLKRQSILKTGEEIVKILDTLEEKGYTLSAGISFDKERELNQGFSVTIVAERYTDDDIKYVIIELPITKDDIKVIEE